LGARRAQQYGLPARVRRQFRRAFRQPDTEDKKLRKDPFGGPCFEGTLRNVLGKPYCFPNVVPWPGRLRTLLLLSKDLDAGRDQEIHKNDRRRGTPIMFRVGQNIFDGRHFTSSPVPCSGPNSAARRKESVPLARPLIPPLLSHLALVSKSYY